MTANMAEWNRLAGDWLGRVALVQRALGDGAGPTPDELGEILAQATDLLESARDPYRVLVAEASDGMCLTRDGQIVLVNRRFVELLRCPAEVVQSPGLDWLDFVAPEHRAEFALWRDKVAGSALRSPCLEGLFHARDGHRFWAKVLLAGVLCSGRPSLLCIIHDATAEKNATEELRRVLRAYRVLSQSSTALARATAEEPLLQEICRIIVEEGGYRRAWVGYPEDGAAGRTVRLAAQVSHNDLFLEEPTLRWDDSPLGRGPTGAAIRTGSRVVVQDCRNHPAYGLWKAFAERYDVASMGAFPLIGRAGAVLGALAVCAGEPDALDGEELDLLQQLADNLSFGICSLRTRAEREALLRNERRAHEVADALREAALAVAQTQGLETLLPTLLVQLQRLVPYDGAAILLSEPDGALRLAATRHPGDGTEEVEYGRMEDDEHLQRVLRLGQAQLIADTASMPGWRPWPVHAPIRSWIGAPLLYGGAIIGVCLLSSLQPGALSNEHAQLAEAFAAHVASAIHNAALFDRVRTANSELERRVEERTSELRQAQERLVRQEKLAVLGQLAGSVGHELRNPLGAIKNAAYYLRLVLNQPDAEVEEMVDILAKETSTCEAIIHGLLDFARPAAPAWQRADVNEVLLDALCHLSVPPDVVVVDELHSEPLLVLCDPFQVAQVCGNILRNAFQAMPEGGTLTLRTAYRDGGISVSISDTGAGIVAENLPRLFEPLFSTRPKGVGLGLAVCKSLVERHGGTIEVFSRVGEGSTFTVWLPVTPPAAQPVPGSA